MPSALWGPGAGAPAAACSWSASTADSPVLCVVADPRSSKKRAGSRLPGPPLDQGRSSENYNRMIRRVPDEFLTAARSALRPARARACRTGNRPFGRVVRLVIDGAGPRVYAGSNGRTAPEASRPVNAPRPHAPRLHARSLRADVPGWRQRRQRPAPTDEDRHWFPAIAGGHWLRCSMSAGETSRTNP
jgi:hypothetical protein